MDLDDAYDLAVRLCARHGLEGWRVELDSAKRRAGVCRHADRVIGLSAPLTRVHDEAEVRDTVLHEIAHALVGPAHRHDAVWRATALRLGCSGQRCVPEQAPRVPGAWVGTCPAGHVHDRHRHPERVVSCRRCSATFSVDHLLQWTRHGRPAAMHPNYAAELRSLTGGERFALVAPGARVRVVVPGPYAGRVGRVVRRGRTRYAVQLPEGVLQVPFAGAEPTE